MEGLQDAIPWGVKSAGGALSIDPFLPPLKARSIVAVDVETDEADNFVGLALCADGSNVFYFTELTSELKDFLADALLIGHNVKGDIRWLRGWGVKVSETNIYADTMIMSYCHNPAKESHALKTLAAELLKLSWPTYKEMVGKRGTKAFASLDKQPVELVANYCGMDALATYRLFKHLGASMTVSTKWFYDNIEMPLYKLLFVMEDMGVKVDTEAIKKLDGELLAEITTLKQKLEEVVGPIKIVRGKKRPVTSYEPFNPNSPSQIQKLFFKTLGINEKSTGKEILVKYKDKPEVEALLSYRKLTKLQGTYTGAFLAIPTLPYIHARFNQVVHDELTGDMDGIDTTRLSSSDPNLQNIPARGVYGKALRSVFVSEPGQVFVCGDYSQVEYRILAHLSQEKRLLAAFRHGLDVHAATASMLFGVKIENVTDEQRHIAKTFNFMAIYGGQAKKAAVVTGLSVPECEKILSEYWNMLPSVSRWILRTKARANRLGGTKTLLGHWIPLPGIYSPNPYDRFHWERTAVNYPIQGGCAEIVKLAMIRLRSRGYNPCLQVHDEILTPVKEEEAAQAQRAIQSVMENVVRLSVPLTVDMGIGRTWQEAKGE